MDTEILYTLDHAINTHCALKINFTTGTYSIDIIRYESDVSPVSTVLQLNSKQFKYLTLPCIPPQSGESHGLVICAPKEKDEITLTVKDITIVVTHKVWHALKRIHTSITFDFNTAVSLIANKNNDKRMLQIILFACVQYRYSLLISKFCKMCGSNNKNRYVRYAQHYNTCIRSNKQKKLDLATKALDSITDYELTAVLHHNNLGTPGLSIPLIIDNDKQRVISSLITEDHRSFNPIGDALFHNYIKHLQDFYDLY